MAQAGQPAKSVAESSRRAGSVLRKGGPSPLNIPIHPPGDKLSRIIGAGNVGDVIWCLYLYASMPTDIRFFSFPKTEPPPHFIPSIVQLFIENEPAISTRQLDKGLTSNEVMSRLKAGLELSGFAVETGKSRDQKIDRPVFYGENGIPTLRYEIDAYSAAWRCGLEIEAGRAWMGNAVYRDLIQAMVMVHVDHLCLAIPNSYKYLSGGKPTISSDYDNTVSVADALWGHSRVRIPYGLTLIGY